MNYRFPKLLAAETITTDKTVKIDLDLDELISRISIRYRATKAAAAMSAPPAGDILKIELLDGSDVLHSTTGYENQALAIYNRKVPTMVHGQSNSGDSQMSAYGIDFGRYLWDEELAFDPAKFSNPKLNIQNDMDVSDASCVTADLEVYGSLFDQKEIDPIGFLMAKEHYDYTCGAENSYEYITLPNDYPIRNLLIRAYRDNYEPWAQIKEARLDENNEKRVPFDYNLEYYHRMQKAVVPPVEELLYGTSISTGRVFYVTPTDYWATLMLSPRAVAPDLYIGANLKGGKVTLTSASNASFLAIARGYLPHHCFRFPLGRPNVIEDWYDVTAIKKARLRLKGGSSTTNGTGQVVLEQLRRY